MNTLSFKTASAKPQEVERKWYLVDAEGQTLGRMSSRIATILRGKNKPSYTPHVDTGDHVIVVNAEKVRLTGKKLTDKEYLHHTGYPGGQRSRSAKDILAKKPEELVEIAVRGMLPKNSLGRKMIKKLHVYAGEDHQHNAQKPETLKFS